jgi:sterol desaturase/sphingolipid hydroxylase (fatty acid hydroxylase superfamily)
MTMMATALDIVSEIRSHFPLIWDIATAFATLVAVFVVVFFLELRFGGDLRRYKTRNFLTDSLYALFYQAGIHNRFVQVPVLAAVALVMPSWHLDLIGPLPPPLRFVVFWLVSDVLSYWVHRWQHNNVFLWSFHSVHHSQTCVTFATTYRQHIVDPLISGVLVYVPLMLLGAPNWYWVPAIALQMATGVSGPTPCARRAAARRSRRSSESDGTAARAGGGDAGDPWGEA